MKRRYLIYIRAPKGDRASDGLSVPDRFEILEEYAKIRGWNVVGHCVDADEPVECAREAKLPNLRRYLAKHSDVDVVVATFARSLNIADHVAMSAISNRGIKIIPITIREEDSESTTAPPAP